MQNLKLSEVLKYTLPPTPCLIHLNGLRGSMPSIAATTKQPLSFPLCPVSVFLAYTQIFSPPSHFLRNYKSNEVQVLSLISLELVQTNSLFLSTLMAVTHNLTVVFFPSNIISIQGVPVSISLSFSFQFPCQTSLFLGMSWHTSLANLWGPVTN